MSDRSSGPAFRPRVEALEARDVPAASPLDAYYLVHSAQGDVQEVFIGWLAMNKATTPAARQFGQKLFQDHYAAFLQVYPLMQAEGVQPQWLDKEQQQNVNKFMHLDGAEFDQQFAGFMVQDPQQDVALANLVANTSLDPLVRANAQQNLPVLQQHLSIATDLNQAFGGKTNGNSD